MHIDFTLYSYSLRWNSFKYTKALWSTKELTSEVATRTMLRARNRHCYSVTTSHTQEAGEGTLNAARGKPHISTLLAFSNSQESYEGKSHLTFTFQIFNRYIQLAKHILYLETGKASGRSCVFSFTFSTSTNRRNWRLKWQSSAFT